MPSGNLLQMATIGAVKFGDEIIPCEVLKPIADAQGAFIEQMALHQHLHKPLPFVPANPKRTGDLCWMGVVENPVFVEPQHPQPEMIQASESFVLVPSHARPKLGDSGVIYQLLAGFYPQH